ncbi:hypothetical protein [uncultured Neglectibacter sp.]|uniref:hypothetical protein n=1 Tax=uncultured Neglectibacter sp. TaxID=1924108 RepID=UPI0034E04733
MVEYGFDQQKNSGCGAAGVLLLSKMQGRAFSDLFVKFRMPASRRKCTPSAVEKYGFAKQKKGCAFLPGKGFVCTAADF